MTELLLILVLIGAVYFTRRIQSLERRVGRLEPVAPPAPERAPAAAPAPTPPRRPEPAPAPAATRVQRPAAPPRAPAFDWRRTVSTADLLGAKALAFAGGVVILGVLFFFVLAVNRGWIGPELRVACGGVASALVFAGGVW